MKNILVTTAMTAGLIANMAWAEVAPSDVSFADGQVAESLTGQPGDPVAGGKIVGDKGAGNCIACHMVSALPDVPFQGNVGPMLDGAGSRWDEAQLRGIVSNAKMTFPDSVMPSFYRVDGYTRPGNAYTGKAADATFAPLLTAQQVEDVVAYLATLKE